MNRKLLLIASLAAILGAVAGSTLKARSLEGALREAARGAARAAATFGITERKVVVTANCNGAERKATYATTEAPKADEVASRVPPGCRLASVNITHVGARMDPALASKRAEAYLESVNQTRRLGARLAGLNVTEENDKPAVTVTVVLERRFLGRTLRGEGGASYSPDEAAVAAEADAKLFAAADKAVAERDKALTGQDTVPGRTVQETGPKAGDPLPQGQQKPPVDVSGGPPTAREIFDVEKIRREFSSGPGPDPNFHDPRMDW